MARCPMTTSRFDLDRLADPPLLELARQSLAIRLTERTQLRLIENPRRVLDHLDSILADEPFWDHFENDSNRGVGPILESLGVLRISSDTRVLCESGVEPVLGFTVFVNVAAILDGDRLPGSEGRARARNYDRDLRIAPDGRGALAMGLRRQPAHISKLPHSGPQRVGRQLEFSLGAPLGDLILHSTFRPFVSRYGICDQPHPSVPGLRNPGTLLLGRQ